MSTERDREENVAMAQLADQAERYEGTFNSTLLNAIYHTQ